MLLCICECSRAPSLGTHVRHVDHNDEIWCENMSFTRMPRAGRNRLTAPVITTTKNSSTMPCTTANTGPDGGLPGASAVNAGILRKLWITSTNTLQIQREHRGHDVNPTPRARKLHAVKRDARDRQQHQRQEHRLYTTATAVTNGNRKPVTLVKIVDSRNIAVMPGFWSEPSRPNMNDKAGHDTDQADDHVDQRKRSQTHTQDHDALAPIKMGRIATTPTR